MFCPFCGTNNLDDARFCSACGKELPQVMNTAEETTGSLADEAKPLKDAKPVTETDATTRVSSHEIENTQAVSDRSEAGEARKMYGEPAAQGQAPQNDANKEQWKLGPQNQGAEPRQAAPRNNPYYIPPASVLPEGATAGTNTEENNTGLIILIIILITLIILVGIAAFAYMHGYIDF